MGWGLNIHKGYIFYLAFFVKVGLKLDEVTKADPAVLWRKKKEIKSKGVIVDLLSKLGWKKKDIEMPYIYKIKRGNGLKFDKSMR